MIFRRISHRIALQFTAFVFVLLLINGALFLFADIQNAQRQARYRLDDSARLVMRQQNERLDLPPRIAPFLREHIRILDANGLPVHTGSFFAEIPFDPLEGFIEVDINGEEFRVLTRAIRRAGVLYGYVQVADIERLPMHQLPFRALLYLLLSIGISLLTYSVGLTFARRSLRPAHDMFLRLEQFTQDASHELKTPITAVGTSLDLALATKSYRPHILRAKKELQDISTLVERLLALARLDRFALHTEPTDLKNLLNEAVATVQSAAEQRGVSIRTEIAEATIVEADPSLLRNVIINILSNAIKFNHPGGTVTVRCTATLLEIRDTGVGIRPDALPHIFDRFYQEERSRTKTNDGVGLGLAVVRRIIELHGWRIEAQSTPGHGSTFTVHFTS